MEQQGKQVRNFISSRIYSLYESKNDSAVRATLAKMRRGVSKNPGETPEIWEVTLADLPESLLGKKNTPSWAEWAVHVALTLFALHQQGNNLKTEQMNKKGITLGTALHMLVKTPDDLARIKRRFDSVATSDSLDELSHHLRGLIQMMKAANIPLDYSALGEDLYHYQNISTRDGVRLAWGRDFYRNYQPESNETTEIASNL